MFYVPAHDVQRPTIPRLHVRNAHDAQVIFEAVRTGALRPVARRLNDAERALFIRSGSVFVWEESEDELGLRRWTDGLLWSQSRMREPFLFYESRPPPDASSHLDDGQTGSRSNSGGRAVVPLIKQTYSAIVSLPNDSQNPGKRRKWHLTAYFSQDDFDQLPTIEHDRLLRTIPVPPGIYRSGKTRQSARTLQLEHGASPIGEGGASGSQGTPSPASYSPPTQSGSSWPTSPSSPSISSAGGLPWPSDPYSNDHPSSPQTRHSHPQFTPPAHASHSNYYSASYSLPSIHHAFGEHPFNPFHDNSVSLRSTYENRRPEDERIIRLLNSRGGIS